MSSVPVEVRERWSKGPYLCRSPPKKYHKKSEISQLLSTGRRGDVLHAVQVWARISTDAEHTACHSHSRNKHHIQSKRAAQVQTKRYFSLVYTIIDEKITTIGPRSPEFGFRGSKFHEEFKFWLGLIELNQTEILTCVRNTNLCHYPTKQSPMVKFISSFCIESDLIHFFYSKSISYV